MNPYTNGNSPKPQTTERLGVVWRWGLGKGPQAKYTGSAQVNNTRGKKAPEIYILHSSDKCFGRKKIENDFLEMNGLYPRTARDS